MISSRHQRRTKIVATVGPASSTPDILGALHEAGVDVFRLNASHGSHEDHAARAAAIRALERSSGRPAGLLMDLQGPKLRVGCFQGGSAMLEVGARFSLDLDPAPGDATRATLPHRELFAALSPGAEILLDDGRLRLRVEAATAGRAECTVTAGGTLTDHKGVNLPGLELPLSALAAKDRDDLAFALELGVDWIGLSFVQRPEDIEEVRALVGHRAGILAKIEKPAAIPALARIVALSDAVMIARGDLGVELPPEEVPSLQKHIVAVCRQAGRPVIVATQMLESMIRSPAPTRAEASDVATAVFDGADAVMLSAESAIGDYPVQAVAMMDRIIRRTERETLHRIVLDAQLGDEATGEADAITEAARSVATALHAAAIATYTTSGSTTLRASRARPEVPILGLTTRLTTARRLTLAWGVCPFHMGEADIAGFGEMVARASDAAVARGIAGAGDRLVVTAGVPFGTPRGTNTLRVVRV